MKRAEYKLFSHLLMSAYDLQMKSMFQVHEAFRYESD